MSINNNERKPEGYFSLIVSVLICVALFFLIITIADYFKKTEDDHYFIDYNDSTYGDFYIVSEKRTPSHEGKDKILLIRDDEYNEYVIVVDEHGNIMNIATK